MASLDRYSSLGSSKIIKSLKRTFWKISSVELPGNGSTPDSHTYMTTPSDHMSLEVVIFKFILSGAI